MAILRDVVKELIAMFLADARLTAAILLLVAIVAGLNLGLDLNALWGGSLLLVGSIAILVEAGVREARLRHKL